MENIQNLGGGVGWAIDSENEISEQQEKIDKVLFISEKIIFALKEAVSIYSKYGDTEAFSTFQTRIDEVMKQASFESFFNDENYKNSGQ